MDNYVDSSDGSRIHYTIAGKGEPTLIFVHGWLGNTRWWDPQAEYFSEKYQVVRIDLAGHGRSTKNRTDWSSRHYSDDILSVINHIDPGSVQLIGHSMSGAYALESSLLTDRIRTVVLVDTLKNLDQLMDPGQAEEKILKYYRNNFKAAVENLLPGFLFCDSTPEHIREQLKAEFLQHDPIFAIKSIEPLYKMDIRGLALKISVPVRGIYSAFTPANRDNNRKYFKDFDYLQINDSGHYPMLEKPVEFNSLLEKIIETTVDKSSTIF